MKRATRKKRTLLWGLIPLIILLLSGFLILALEYIQVKGFKNALIQLVHDRTKGAFALSIDHTEINFTDLSFSLKDITIAATSKAGDSISIRKIIIPELEVNAGSIWNSFSMNQLIVEKIRLREPLARIDLHSHKHKNLSTINVAHQVTQFYPAIKAFLERFDIKEFRIDRAQLALIPDSREQETISIRLIDLFMADWNMKDLSDQAQLNLSLARQHFSFPDSDVSFDAIRYNYDRHELAISNYRFVQRDSLQREVFKMEGASLRIVHMDYDALMIKEAYSFESLEIDSPKVTATLYGSANPDPVPHSRHPVSDLLKKNVGELYISEGHIRNASLRLNLISDSDSVKLSIPRLDLDAGDFLVTAGQETLSMKSFLLNIFQTELDLPNDLFLSFGQLHYNEKYDLTLTGVGISDATARQELVSCDRVDLYDFDVFRYLYENDLAADSVYLHGGRITIRQEADYLSDPRRPATKRQATSMHVGRIHLTEIDLTYAFGDGTGRVYGLEGQADNLVKSDRFSYEIQYLKAQKVSLVDQARKLRINGQNVFCRPDELQIKNMTAVRGQLSMHAVDFHATPQTDNATTWKALDQLRMRKLTIQGELDFPKNKNDSAASQVIRSLKADTVDIRSNYKSIYLTTLLYNVDLQLNKNNIIKFQTGRSTIRKGDGEITWGRAEVNSAATSVMHLARITHGTSDTVTIERIEGGKVVGGNGIPGLSSAGLYGIDWKRRNFSMQLDSVDLFGLQWKENTPYADELAVRGIKARLIPDPGPNDHKTAPIRTGSYFNRIMLTDAEISMNTGLARFDSLGIVNGKAGHWLIQGLQYRLPAGVVKINRLERNENDLLFRDVDWLPAETPSEDKAVQQDDIKLHIPLTIVRNVNWDTLQTRRKLVSSGVEIKGMVAEIYRDKTLPEPDPVVRPWLLTELMANDAFSAIPVIAISEGKMVYTENGQNTGEKGHITFDGLRARWNRSEGSQPQLEGTFTLNSQGKGHLQYTQLDPERFSLQLSLEKMDLTALNTMVTPLQAVRIKSGYLRQYELSVTGDSIQATGQAMISYEGLHVEIYKKNSPDIRNLGSGLLTFLANDLVLRNNKDHSVSTVSQLRNPYKSPFNYWVKTALHGVAQTVRSRKR